MAKLVGHYLEHIRISIERIESITTGMTLADYAADWHVRFSVERAIEIISEAARRIPPELTAAHPQIPWRRIAGIGNVLRHDYDGIADRIIFEVVTGHLPPLKAAVIAMEAVYPPPPAEARGD